MATLRLYQGRIDSLKPRRSACDVRGRELKGFGVRGLPSGAKRHFVHSQRRGRRVWKIVGDREIEAAAERIGAAISRALNVGATGSIGRHDPPAFGQPNPDAGSSSAGIRQV